MNVIRSNTGNNFSFDLFDLTVRDKRLAKKLKIMNIMYGGMVIVRNWN